MKKVLKHLATWWRSRAECDVILKDYRSNKDLESSVQGPCHNSEHVPSFESISSIHHNLPLHYDNIKCALTELTNTALHNLQTNLADELQWHGITQDNIRSIFGTASDVEINIGLLWAAFFRRLDLVKELLELGAELSFYEHTYGLSALHLAAYSDSKEIVEHLLSLKGCYVNVIFKCYSPLHCAAFGNSAKVAELLLEKGANIDAFTNDLYNNLEDVFHCAVRANAAECISLLCQKGANINQLDSHGRTPVHLASELGHTECLKVLLRAKSVKINQKTKEKLRTALHFAAEKCHPSCVEVLVKHGALANIVDYKFRTPLHLASLNQCQDCVKILLRDGKADPNLCDVEQRTPLHLAVVRSSQVNSSDIIRVLIGHGAEIHAMDNQGCTPLHLAARHELSVCVETLISCGADITKKCKAGITALKLIYQKTPDSIEAIRKKLDDLISFSHHDGSNKTKQVDLKIDFTGILQQTHPQEVLFSYTLLEEGQKELLLHPVCSAFLHLKWKKIRKFFIFRAFCFFMLVLSMTGYVLLGLAKHCYNLSKNVTLTDLESDRDLCFNRTLGGELILRYPFIVELLWYLTMIFSLGIIIRKLCGFPGNTGFKMYIGALENILDIGTILSVFLISFIYTGRTYIWQNHVSAFGVLITWTNLFYTLGQFPFFGTYIAMYASVQNEFGKLLFVFSSLLVGFTVSFCVLFPQSNVFSHIYIGFISVIVMAIGDVNLDLITNPTEKENIFMLHGSAEIVYLTFVTFVSIVLLNLLVGIVVHDIQGLKKTAKLRKLMKATHWIYRIEKAVFQKKVLTNLLGASTLVSAKGICVLNVKISKQRQNILPQDVLDDAIEIATRNKRKKKKNARKMIFESKSLANLNIDVENSYSSAKDIYQLKRDIHNVNVQVVNLKNTLESSNELLERVVYLINSDRKNSLLL